MTQPTSAPRPAIVNIAFWLVAAGAVLLLAGGLLGLTSAFGTPRSAFAPELSDGEVRSIVIMRGGISGLLVLAGVALSFLAGRARNGDLRFRRSTVWLSASLVALVFVLTLLARSRSRRWRCSGLCRWPSGRRCSCGPRPPTGSWRCSERG